MFFGRSDGLSDVEIDLNPSLVRALACGSQLDWLTRQLAPLNVQIVT